MKFSPPQTDQDKIRAIQIYRSARVGPRNFAQLLSKSVSFEAAWEALREAYKEQKIDPRLLGAEADAQMEIETAEKQGAKFVYQTDPIYPELLKNTAAAPPFFWIKGDLEILKRPMIAMVGARYASLEGVRMAHGLARELAEAGFSVVSGLARGIDTAAHEGALPIATIAIVAGGIDVFYPKQNTRLQMNIGDRGLIISEMPFGFEPQATNFPQRNRIIAGLSQATIVVEGTLRSGTMITAHNAAEFGRDVMAIPGHPFNPRSEGPNHLIREGALLVRNAQDILEAMGQNPLYTQNVPQSILAYEAEDEGEVGTPDYAKRGLEEINGNTVRGLDDRVSRIG